MTENKTVKWREIYSLAALNAAVVISWIAYHEYQPVLMEKFNFTSLVDFLIVTKAIVLVVIPPIAGLFADRIMKKNGKFFIIFTVGIGATAMIFMIVASIIGAGPVSVVRPFLPFMIILWLVSMNLFISPANSMIEAFAPVQKLPMVMGVLFLVTELIYALEPVVVSLVHFFGDTLTFVVGGVLIAGSGYLFHLVSSDEVIQRKQQLLASEDKKSQTFMSFLAILVIGLLLGLAKAFLVEFLPDYMDATFEGFAINGEYVSFGLLGFAALLAFAIGGFVSRQNLTSVLMVGFGVLLVGVIVLILAPNAPVFIVGGVLSAVAFSVINVSGLPYAIKSLTVNHLTYGVGIYLGASEIFTGLMEIYLHRA